MGGRGREHSSTQWKTLGYDESSQDLPVGVEEPPAAGWLNRQEAKHRGRCNDRLHIRHEGAALSRIWDVEGRGQRRR
jgi:hypothetical protein